MALPIHHMILNFLYCIIDRDWVMLHLLILITNTMLMSGQHCGFMDLLLFNVRGYVM